MTAAELAKQEVEPDRSEEACFPRLRKCTYKAGPVAANGASKHARRYRGNTVGFTSKYNSKTRGALKDLELNRLT